MARYGNRGGAWEAMPMGGRVSVGSEVSVDDRVSTGALVSITAKGSAETAQTSFLPT